MTARIAWPLAVVMALALPVTLTGAASSAEPGSNAVPDIRHFEVFREDGKFGGWPANGGMWSWGDEILVSFTVGDHKESGGHTVDWSTTLRKFARSLDGGETWAIEDAYEQGITGRAMNHRLGDKARPPRELEKPIDFSRPDFALLFQRVTNERGPSDFYYSYDRGKSWAGPFRFSELDPAGIATRTDYVVDGPRGLSCFLSVDHGRTALARTSDGGMTWKLVSHIGPDFTRAPGYALMPSSVRLSPSRWLTVIRYQKSRRECGLVAYRSDDNGATWKEMTDPLSPRPLAASSPPALLKLQDGRLCLTYAVREPAPKPSRICAKLSDDEGRTWGDERVLRADPGAMWDLGYNRVVQRADGKVVTTYYYNTAMDGPPYRYIAATIWDPGR